MYLQSRHFHLIAAAIAVTGALVALFFTKFFLASFLLAGGVIALTHWKASKARLIDG